MRKLLRVSIGVALAIAPAASGQPKGWHFENVDPKSGRRVIEIDAKSFEQSDDGKVEHLHDVTARFWRASGRAKQIHSQEAVADFKSGTLRYGPALRDVVSLKTGQE